MKYGVMFFIAVFMSVLVLPGPLVFADDIDLSGEKQPVETNADSPVQAQVDSEEVIYPEKETSGMNEASQSQETDSNLRNAHQYFAASLNGEVWNLLQKPDRSAIENERMIHAAHASCYHWLVVGTAANHQRGEWLVARIYTVLEISEAALRHATRCLELTHQHKEQMKDFDWAYAYEGMARAHALAGNRDEAVSSRNQAEKYGNLIEKEEDKALFMSDLQGGNWHGVP
jgi:hypothetical protein